MTKKILIVSGEPSGDLHASNLVKDLKRLDKNIEFFGMGGSLSKKAGVEIVFDITDLALIGAVEVLKNISTVGKAYKNILRKIDTTRPDLAILVDYPGFNLRLARELKKRSIPVVYYISPQVWAWGRDRVRLIKKYVKKILVFFKFEEELYKTCDINAEFVGHPLLDSVKVTTPKEEVIIKYSLADAGDIVALLPGSRESEVRTLLPIMMGAAKILSQKLQRLKFVIVKYPDLPISLYENALKETHFDVRLANGDAHNVLNASDIAIVASGTTTLESAIIGTPLIITYKVNLITYLLYKIVSRIRFIGLVNIIAGHEIAPELLQYDARPEKIAQAAYDILSNGKRLSDIRSELKKVTSSLGSPGASLRAANADFSLLK
jgi:lipid-A-disaccharide synthase